MTDDRHHFKALLKNTNFIKLWLSQMFSQFTINIMNFYVLTRVFALTESSLAVSFMWLAGAIPALLLGPFAGSIVDNFSRRTILIVTNILQAGVIFCALFVSEKVFLLYAVVFFYWLLDQFYFPSQQASTPRLVPAEYLTAANGLFLLTQQASVFVGFGLGGILLTIFGPVGTVLIASANLLLAAASVYYLPRDPDRPGAKDKDFLKFWHDFQVGYDYLRQHRRILLPILLLIGSQVLISVIAVLLPGYVRSVLGLDLKHASITLIVPGALGAFAATYLLPRLSKTHRTKSLVQVGLILAATGLLIMSLLRLAPAKIYIAVATASLLGGAVASITVPIQSLVQSQTPKHLHGRVYGQMNFLLILATILPMIVSATIADILGISRFMGILGLILLSAYLFIRHRGDNVLANRSWL